MLICELYLVYHDNTLRFKIINIKFIKKKGVQRKLLDIVCGATHYLHGWSHVLNPNLCFAVASSNNLVTFDALRKKHFLKYRQKGSM